MCIRRWTGHATPERTWGRGRGEDAEHRGTSPPGHAGSPACCIPEHLKNWKYTGQCGGSGIFIPDPTFFHPRSRIRTVSIPDPGSNPQKKQKNGFLSSKKYDPGCSSRIPMLTFSHPGSRIQGSKRHPIPDPGSGSATLIRVDKITNCND